MTIRRLVQIKFGRSNRSLVHFQTSLSFLPHLKSAFWFGGRRETARLLGVAVVHSLYVVPNRTYESYCPMNERFARVILLGHSFASSVASSRILRETLLSVAKDLSFNISIIAVRNFFKGLPCGTGPACACRFVYFPSTFNVSLRGFARFYNLGEIDGLAQAHRKIQLNIQKYTFLLI